MILVQLDVKRGNVNDIVNDSIRSSYQVGCQRRRQQAMLTKSVTNRAAADALAD